MGRLREIPLAVLQVCEAAENMFHPKMIPFGAPPCQSEGVSRPSS